MAHVDKCPTCARVWDEMQAAQSLVLGLQEHRVGQGFRNEVWNRIHSGEGATEILLQEPISMATKIRYGAIGAAAAALCLVAFHLLTQDRAPTSGFGRPDLPDRVATIDVATIGDATIDGGADRVNDPGHLESRPRPNRLTPGSAVSSPTDSGFEPEPLTAATLANRTVNEVTLAAKRLRLKRGALLERPGETPSPVWVEVRRDVQTIGDGLHFLQNLERERLVEFGGASRACMSEAQQHFARGTGPAIDSKLEIQKFVQALTLCPLENLEGSLRYTQRATLSDPLVIHRILQQAGMERFIRQFFEITTAPAGVGNGRSVQLMFRGGNPMQSGAMVWRTERSAGTPDRQQADSEPDPKTLKKRN
jgi:hypothetical protein